MAAFAPSHIVSRRVGPSNGDFQYAFLAVPERRLHIDRQTTVDGFPQVGEQFVHSFALGGATGNGGNLRPKRVLTKDSPENRSFFGEGVKIVVEVVVDPQRQIDHFDDLGDDLRAAAKPCEKVADVAVVLFDRDGQVFAGEELVIRDEAVIALPIIGDERLAFEADFGEELLACGVITATKNPGDGSPSNRVIGSPKPQFLSLFFTKCHISSRVTTTTSALVDGSGSLRASSRTQFRTATSLTPRMRAIEPKLTLPMA